MAVEQSQVLPAPVLEGALTAFTKKLTPLIGQKIDTTKFDPKVAAQTQLQKDASAAAAGLGSLVGPQAFQQFMSPYQQQVIDTTLAEFDRQQAIQQTGLRDDAVRFGAFGGARQGIQAAEAANQAALGRAGLQAQLLQEGFQQARAAAADDLAARQGLGEFQQAMGQADQLFNQAQLDAQQIAGREAQFEPFTRLGLIGQQLSQIQPGALPVTTVGYQPSAAPASPLASFLGGAAGAGGVLGKLGIFG
jgi:hypothetical protein|tara:strand:- start:119 stop:862 length:744 start_codon:yes stop_codon:yes gene_type:complete